MAKAITFPAGYRSGCWIVLSSEFRRNNQGNREYLCECAVCGEKSWRTTGVINQEYRRLSCSKCSEQTRKAAAEKLERDKERIEYMQKKCLHSNRFFNSGVEL